MIKNTLFVACCVAAFSQGFSQETDYNKWSAELRFGVNHAIAPVAHGYDTPFLGIGHLGIGGRYMLNNRAGIKLGVGYNRFGPTTKSLDFNTNYFRVSAEGVINLGNTLHFNNWTDRLGLLLHAGLGYSTMKGEGSTLPWDEMVHAIGGITPQVKLNDSLSLSLDVSLIGHVYQSRTFDYSRVTINPNIDGWLYEVTAGLSYNFGSKEKHADWVGDANNSKDLEASRKKIAELEEQLRQQSLDDDNDGVLNHLDLEPGTAPGALVNTKGQTQVPQKDMVKDTDGDGVADFADSCPETKGLLETRGCPDQDGDGIADKDDKCPAIYGVKTNNGCPEIKESTKKVFEKALKGIQFETGKDVIKKSSFSILNDVVKIMKDNPSYLLEINGHTDNQGDDAKNLTLSQQRAEAVKAYLVRQGINESRLMPRGYGETAPKATNDTPAGRAENRRVEFVVRFETTN